MNAAPWGPLTHATRHALRPFALSSVARDVLTVGRRTSLEQALTGKLVLITGASSGIGHTAARHIAAAGGEVILVARSADKLDALADQIRSTGGAAHVYPCDLSDLDAVGELVDRVLRDLGVVDVLVNNAGRSIRRSLETSYDRMDDYQRTISLNYLAPVRLGLGFLPGMRERGDGHIINISSIGVEARIPRFGAYIGSKAALEAVADAWAAETVPDGVHITTISMPLVRTPMSDATAMYRELDALTPDEAAEVICRAIVDRPPRMSTTFGSLAGAADRLAPYVTSVFRRKFFAGFDESVDAAK